MESNPFRTAVPISVSHLSVGELDDVIAQLRSMRADTVFLCGLYFDRLDDYLDKFTQMAPRLRASGIEPYIWVEACLYHLSYAGMGFRKMVTIDGDTDAELTCPADPRFVSYYCEQLRKVSGLPADTMVIDDDFRMSFVNKQPVCFCSRHMELYRKALGYAVTREEMKEKLLAGNETVRHAWLQVNADLLRSFARQIREAVNPAVRVALCGGPALWGADAVGAAEIAKILAGRHKPFLRLSGSPYWIYFQQTFGDLGQNIGSIVNFARMQAAVCKKEGIETVGEGDTYPRPRYQVGASQLENFDLGLRADGSVGGILKFVFDYNSIAYEKGYVQRAVQNRPLQEAVGRIFGGKEPTGVAVYTSPAPLLAMDTACVRKREEAIANSPVLRFLNDNSISATFSDTGTCQIFGVSGKTVPISRLRDGAILDITAARCLQARGIDVGIRIDTGNVCVLADAGPMTYDQLGFEYFADGSAVPLVAPRIHQIIPADGAQLCSRFAIGGREYAGVYLYENREGQRFCVMPFDAWDCPPVSGLFRSYGRQRQLCEEVIPWLSGRPLDAVCMGHPDLYILTKKNENELAVGLWNYSRDRIDAPMVTLGEQYRFLETVQCQGSLDGRRVRLSTLYSQEFACFLVRK